MEFSFISVAANRGATVTERTAGRLPRPGQAGMAGMAAADAGAVPATSLRRRLELLRCGAPAPSAPERQPCCVSRCGGKA